VTGRFVSGLLFPDIYDHLRALLEFFD
jgi:hypothetical protein